MQQTFFRKRRLVIAIGSCIVLLAVTFTSAIGTSGNPQTIQQEKVYNLTSPLPAPLKGLFKFRLLNRDWDYWSNPPNLFAISSGNVGIGTTEPQEKLVVTGENKTGLVVVPEDVAVVLGCQKNYFPYYTHYNLRLYWNQSGFASGVSVGGNYLGSAPDDGMTIQGNVGIGTTRPTAKLDVRGGNITQDGFNVCSYVGFAQQNANLTISGQDTWFDVPGVILNFTLATNKVIDIRAFGSSYSDGDIGLRFMVDGIPYGDPTYGDLLIDEYGVYHPWYLERIVTLQPGNHNVKLQVKTIGSSYVYWYNYDYWAARLIVQTY